MHKFNREFFKEITTEQQAYILGFIYADGYNSEKQLCFAQLEQDEDVLIQIKNALQADNEITKKVQKVNGKIRCELTFSSVEMCQDLTNLGAIRAKSLLIEFPDENIIPKKLMPHFIRGYFDGDGCVWNGKRKIMKVKDDTRSTGYRERIVHNVKFTFTGNFKFIEALQEYLVENKIVSKKTKLNFSKAKETKHICTMEYSGRKQLKNLFDFMYKDATIYGRRKFDKFKEIFCALEEKSSKDTSLIAGTPEMATSSQASKEEGSTTIPEMGVDSSESKCEAPNE